MLDIRLFREQPEFVKEGLANVGAEPDLVDRVLELDTRRRALETEIGALRNQRNIGSKNIGKAPDNAAREAAKAEMRALGDRIAREERELDEVAAQLRDLLLTKHPLSDEVLRAVLRREQPLDAWHLTQVLLQNSPLNQHNMAGVRIHDYTHEHWKADVDIIVPAAGERVGVLVCGANTTAVDFGR